MLREQRFREHSWKGVGVDDVCEEDKVRWGDNTNNGRAGPSINDGIPRRDSTPLHNKSHAPWGRQEFLLVRRDSTRLDSTAPSPPRANQILASCKSSLRPVKIYIGKARPCLALTNPFRSSSFLRLVLVVALGRQNLRRYLCGPFLRCCYMYSLVEVLVLVCMLLATMRCRGPSPRHATPRWFFTSSEYSK